jgi:hypothetical protein
MPPDGAASRLKRPARWLILLLLAVLSPLGSTAPAAETGSRYFHLPAGEAADTLKQFAVQAQREIMFPAEPVAGVRTNRVEGMLTPRDALERLVAKTGLAIVEDPKTGALMVTRPATTVAKISEPNPELHPSRSIPEPYETQKSPRNRQQLARPGPRAGCSGPRGRISWSGDHRHAPRQREQCRHRQSP